MRQVRHWGKGIDREYKILSCVNEESLGRISELACLAGGAAGKNEQWSVDVLETGIGWYVTDMALARDSWHWPGCRTAIKGRA